MDQLKLGTIKWLYKWRRRNGNLTRRRQTLTIRNNYATVVDYRRENTILI